MTYRLNDRLEIEFSDPCHDVEWKAFEKVIKSPPDAKCKVIGYYYGEDEKFVYLSSMITRTQKKGERDKIAIPKGIVEKIRILKPERFKK